MAVGLVFAGLVVVHLLQRRHRVARMLAPLGRYRPRAERELRLLASDAVVALITINAVVSRAENNAFTPIEIGKLVSDISAASSPG